MPRFEFNDPYSKRVLPDEFVSPAWLALVSVVTSSSTSSGTVIDDGGDGEVVVGNWVMTDDGFFLTDDALNPLLFD